MTVFVNCTHNTEEIQCDEKLKKKEMKNVGV